MERFLQRHASRVLGSISGFDRVLFRGVLRSISYVQGLDWFMGSQRVGFKDFQGFVEKFSAGIKRRAREIAEQAGRPFLYVGSGKRNKQALVRELLAEQPVKEGLICVLSCVEPCVTFTVRRDREKRQLRLLPRDATCLHFLLLLSRPRFWPDAYPFAKLVAIEYPGVRERAGVVSPTDAAGGDRLPAEGQLFYADQ